MKNLQGCTTGAQPKIIFVAIFDFHAILFVIMIKVLKVLDRLKFPLIIFSVLGSRFSVTLIKDNNISLITKAFSSTLMHIGKGFFYLNNNKGAFL